MIEQTFYNVTLFVYVCTLDHYTTINHNKYNVFVVSRAVTLKSSDVILCLGFYTLILIAIHVTLQLHCHSTSVDYMYNVTS